MQDKENKISKKRKREGEIKRRMTKEAFESTIDHWKIKKDDHTSGAPHRSHTSSVAPLQTVFGRGEIQGYVKLKEGFAYTWEN